MENMHPSECEYSIRINETYICRLECLPCGLHFGRPCAKEQVDDAVEAMAGIIWGDKHEAD